MRRFTLFWVLSLISIVGVLFFLFQNERAGTQQNVGVIQSVSNYDLAKLNGFKGSQSQYLASLKGQDSVSTKTIIEKPIYLQNNTTIEKTQVVNTNTPVPGENGKSPECLSEVTRCRGNDGKPIELSFNATTKELMWRVQGQRGWSLLTTACEVLGNCGVK